MVTNQPSTLPFILIVLFVGAATAATLPPAASTPLPPDTAPSLPPSPAFAGPDCNTALLNLTSCLSYVQQGANLTVPEKGCCASLAGLVDSNPICLCKLLSAGDAFGIKIDDAKSLMLPTVCHVQTPPVSLCNVLGIPVPSPGALSPGSGASAGAGAQAAQPSGSSPGLSPVTPATQIAAPPSSDGGPTAGVAVQLALLAIVSQVTAIFF